MKRLFLVFLLCITSVLVAQEHGEIRWIAGKKYTYHKVEKQQTLYGISTTYEVEQNDILLNNPEAIDGLQPGMLLRIPLTKEKKTEIDLSGADLIHNVKPKETLYSLSKKYQVPVDSIKAYNDLSEGLKVDMRLIIPIQKESIKQRKVETKERVADSLIQSRVTFDSLFYDSMDLKVAVLMPLFLDQNDTLEINKEENEKDRLPDYASISIQYYGGILLALDSIKELGYDISLDLFDTNQDLLTFDSVLAKTDFHLYDLVIGPVQPDNFNQFCANYDSSNFAILSSFMTDKDLLSKHENIIKAQPKRMGELNQLRQFTRDYAPNKNVMFVYQTTMRGDYQESKYIFEAVLKDSVSASMDTNYITPKMINYRALGFEGLKRNLMDSTENVLVIPSTDQSFVSKLLQDLSIIESDTVITVVGTDPWKTFQSFEPKLFEIFNVHLSCQGVLDYGDTNLIDFQNRYFERFKEEPTLTAIQAYEQVLLVAKVIAENNGFSPHLLDGVQGEGIYRDYEFKSVNRYPGAENYNAFMVQFKDYQFVKIQNDQHDQ